MEIVTVCVALVPVVRLPKLSDAGDADSWSVEEMPVPLKGTTSGEFVVLLINVMLPEADPAEAGVKPTLNVDEPPAGTESGKANPEKVNPAPEREA